MLGHHLVILIWCFRLDTNFGNHCSRGFIYYFHLVEHNLKITSLKQNEESKKTISGAETFYLSSEGTDTLLKPGDKLRWRAALSKTVKNKMKKRKDAYLFFTVCTCLTLLLLRSGERRRSGQRRSRQRRRRDGKRNVPKWGEAREGLCVGMEGRRGRQVQMQGEDFGGGVWVSVDRGNGAGAGSAEEEGVALLRWGVTWTQARRCVGGCGAKQQQHNNNNNNNWSVNWKQKSTQKKMHKIRTDSNKTIKNRIHLYIHKEYIFKLKDIINQAIKQNKWNEQKDITI